MDLELKSVLNFMQANPQMFYKWIPTFLILYYSYPLAIFLWEWFPWITSTYMVYSSFKQVENWREKIYYYADKTKVWLLNP